MHTPLIYVVTPLGQASSMGMPTACRVTAHPPPPTPGTPHGPASWCLAHGGCHVLCWQGQLKTFPQYCPLFLMRSLQQCP